MSPQEINVQELFVRIDYHIKIAIRRRQARFDEVDDLKQDLVLAVFVRCTNFDPTKSSWSTFLNNVLEMEIRQFRMKRRWMKNRMAENIDDIDEDDQPLTNLCPTYELNEVERHAFLGEIMEEINRLPKRLKKVCLLLLTYSKARTAEILRMKDATLSKRLHKIRELFDESPVIRDYFEKF